MPKLSQNERLARLVAETRGKDRFQDLAMVFRRPMCVFTVPVRAEQIVIGAGVKFRILADAQAGIPVPITSEIIGQSAQVQAGAVVTEPNGLDVGRFVPELILRAGGVWDHFLHGWVMDGAERRAASVPLVLDLQESQIAFAVWWASVLLRWRNGEPLDVSAALMIGGRRAGKTWLGNMALWALILDRPFLSDGSKAIGWQISVTFREKEEIDRQVKELIPQSWYTFAAAANVYTLAHGPTITNLSARNPQSLRRGRGDVLFLNECQKMHRRAFVNALPATADRGGILLMAANPPTEDDTLGEWIYEIYDAAQEAKTKNEVPPVLIQDFSWTENKAINAVARARVAAAIRVVSPEAAEADEQGVVKPVGLRACWAFDRRVHVQALPDGPDITEDYTRSRTREGYPYLAGSDFQNRPYHCMIIYKIFGSIERPILHAMDVIMTTGDEDDLIDDLEQAGYGNRDVLVIGDASGEIQDGIHSRREGRTSYAYFRARGYKILPPREKIGAASKAAKNPDVHRSLNLTNTWLTDGRYLVAPDLDPVISALKNCKAKRTDGGLRPADRKWGHLVDCARYPTWWCTPARKPSVATPRKHTRVSSNWRERERKT